MSEIPEDVWSAAYTVFDDQVITPGVIARAILAERRRCAEVARHLNGWGHPPAPELAYHIARIIESGQ